MYIVFVDNGANVSNVGVTRMHACAMFPKALNMGCG
jgi:hypothetical protein